MVAIDCLSITYRINPKVGATNAAEATMNRHKALMGHMQGSCQMCGRKVQKGACLAHGTQNLPLNFRNGTGTCKLLSLIELWEAFDTCPIEVGGRWHRGVRGTFLGEGDERGPGDGSFCVTSTIHVVV